MVRQRARSDSYGLAPNQHLAGDRPGDRIHIGRGGAAATDIPCAPETSRAPCGVTLVNEVIPLSDPVSGDHASFGRAWSGGAVVVDEGGEAVEGPGQSEAVRVVGVVGAAVGGAGRRADAAGQGVGGGVEGPGEERASGGPPVGVLRVALAPGRKGLEGGAGSFRPGESVVVRDVERGPAESTRRTAVFPADLVTRLRPLAVRGGYGQAERAADRRRSGPAPGGVPGVRAAPFGCAAALSRPAARFRSEAAVGWRVSTVNERSSKTVIRAGTTKPRWAAVASL
jgi:hypothetical protein